MCSCSRNWSHRRAARALLDRLTPDDLRLVWSTPLLGPEQLVWAAASPRGGLIFEALAELRHRALSDCGRRHVDWSAEAIVAVVPAVSEVLAARFGDPAPWRGLGAEEASRRWRAQVR